ncbi:hypothetical protein [Haloferula sp.]|uniref:hypothetical protein n=1 Tax=Haloferula sp. TaxID=2497595 RepID=UPI003C755934
MIPFFLALACAGLTHAKEATKTIDPKAVAVLEKGIEAAGGKEAMGKITSRIMKGTIEMPAQGMSMTMETKQKAPSMSYSKMVIPDMMTAEEIFNGKEGWAKDSIQGTRKLAGAELARLKEGAALFPELQTLADLAAAKVLPDATEEDRTFSVIETTSKDGIVKTQYFDQETDLPNRVVMKLSVGPDSEMEVDVRVSDYKEVDGIKMPHSMTMLVSSQELVMKITEVQHNQEIDDEIFSLKK